MKLLCSALLLILLSLIPTNYAWPQRRPELVSQIGHRNSILALAMSPDNNYLASAGIDKTIIIWDLRLRKQLYSLKGHSQWVYALDFSPDGKLLASGSDDRTVKLWNIFRGTREGEIVLDADINSVVFSPDGSMLAIATDDSAIKLWDVSRQNFKPELKGRTSGIKSITFSPDSKRLASASRDGEMTLWNLTTMKADLDRKIDSKIDGLAYGPSGDLVAVGTLDSGIGLWNTKTDKLEIKNAEKNTPSVDALDFISDHEIAYIGGSKIWIRNLETNLERPIGESTSGKGSHAIAVSSDNALLAFNDGQNIKLFDLKTSQPADLKGGFESVYGVVFSTHANYLFGNVGNNLMDWGDEFGVEEPEQLSMMARLLGRRFAYISSQNVIARVPEVEGGAGGTDVEFLKFTKNAKSYPVLKAHSKSIQSIVANAEGTGFVTSSEDGFIKFWEVGNPAPLKTLAERARGLAYSPDGRILATESLNGIKLWNTQNWEYRVIPNQFGKLVFSPDSTILAVLTSDLVNLFDVSNLKRRASFGLDSTPKDFSARGRLQAIHVLFAEIANVFEISLSFSRDSKMIAFEERNRATGTYTVKVCSVDGKEVYELEGHSAAIPSTNFSPNGSILASGSWDTTIRLWSTKTGREVATIAPLDKDNWIIYTPDGRFETNTDLEDNQNLHWSMPGDPLNPLPLDIFMRDYSEPNLFQRLLDCSDTNSCGDEFQTIRDLSDLNLVRPNVTFTNVSGPDVHRRVDVTIEVSSGSGVTEREDGRRFSRTTGVYDLRVFRDRQLIAVAPADGAEKLRQLGASAGNSEAELKVWREASEIRLDPKLGKQTISFKVQLPQSKDISDVRLTAYAFNDDRVKSPTAKYEWTAAQKASSGKVPQSASKRRAYVVSVGVSKSHLPEWNLNHGADDAYEFQKVVPEKLRRVGTYDVIPIELVSDLKGGKFIDNATKQNIKTVFDLLAGREVSPEAKQKIPNFQQIRAAMPDDFVLITFSSHGYSVKGGDFYLFPSDVALSLQTQPVPDFRSMISGEEMSIWLREVDAGNITIIIDACQSASAVVGLQFKPGPLGGRGLGQLAYDKRMTILAATQASEDALEVLDGPINQGLLSYALSHEGFSDPDAGEDGKIMLKEWLEFAEGRVSSLYRDVIDQKLKGVVLKRGGRVVRRGDRMSPAIQRASLFDFSRENGEIVLAVSTPTSEGP